MSGSELKLREQQPLDRRQIDCVEIYLPKRVRFLPELYQLLRDKVTNRLGQVVLDGYSIYEVDGVFRGEKLWDERTLVIRLLLVRPAGRPEQAVNRLIRDLGNEIITKVAASEEAIWICHYPQSLTVFAGLKRLFT